MIAAAALRLSLGRLQPLIAAFAREGEARPRATRRGGATAVPRATGPAEPEPSTRRELHESDSLLFSSIAGGDPSALAALYDRYGRFVYSLCLRSLRDRAEAEDALQEIFLKVWSRAGQFDARRGSALSWLGTLARRHAIDRLRAAGSRPSLAPATSEEEGESNARDAAPDEASLGPESRTILDEDRAAVRRGLLALPPEQRLLLELAYFDGLSQSEIAEHVSAPLGTVKTRMRAGLKTLRESLSERFEGEEGRS